VNDEQVAGAASTVTVAVALAVAVDAVTWKVPAVEGAV
jgi:hypothetical protein